MNKQEAIEKIKGKTEYFKVKKEYDRGFRDGLNSSIPVIREIDEPEKPVVPQYVADWLEVCKDNLPLSLANSMNNIVMRSSNQPDKTIHWLAKNSETFAKAWIYGYEVEKEKLYTVELPNPNGGTHLVLCKDCDGKLFIETFFIDDWETFGKCKLTEAEIKQDFDWAWQFAKEVENG
nr:DUF1642 domain-containing protein [Streptococcus lutetiensis]